MFLPHAVTRCYQYLDKDPTTHKIILRPTAWDFEMALISNIFLLLMCLYAGNIHEITNIDPEKKEKIDSFINCVLFSCDRNQYVGSNLAIVYQGEVV